MTLRPSTADRVRAIIAHQLGVDVRNDGDQLNSDLRADSLDVVEIIMELESDFGLEIADPDVTESNTVGEIIAYIERRNLNAPKEAPRGC